MVDPILALVGSWMELFSWLTDPLMRGGVAVVAGYVAIRILLRRVVPTTGQLVKWVGLFVSELLLLVLLYPEWLVSRSLVRARRRVPMSFHRYGAAAEDLAHGLSGAATTVSGWTARFAKTGRMVSVGVLVAVFLVVNAPGTTGGDGPAPITSWWREVERSMDAKVPEQRAASA